MVSNVSINTNKILSKPQNQKNNQYNNHEKNKRKFIVYGGMATIGIALIPGIVHPKTKAIVQAANNTFKDKFKYTPELKAEFPKPPLKYKKPNITSLKGNSNKTDSSIRLDDIIDPYIGAIDSNAPIIRNISEHVDNGLNNISEHTEGFINHIADFFKDLFDNVN